MDGNTMRWLGAFLHAANERKPEISKDTTSISLRGGFTVKRNRIANHFGLDAQTRFLDVEKHQACAVVEQLLLSEPLSTNKEVGRSNIQYQKRQKLNSKSSKILT